MAKIIKSIRLEPESMALGDALARVTGISFALHLRLAWDAYLKEHPKYYKAKALVEKSDAKAS